MEWPLTQRVHTGTGKNTIIQLIQTEKHNVNAATAGYVVTVQKPCSGVYGYIVRYEHITAIPGWADMCYSCIKSYWMPKQIGVICLSKQLVLHLSI